MCNRYVSPDQAAIERYWHIGRHNQPRWADEIFPRAQGPFIRRAGNAAERQLVVGQWGLIPWFAETPKLTYSTNNARFEGIATKASYKQSWLHGKRCIIPAWSFDEPCWETGRNVWWSFRRVDGAPWGLAGLWNDWTDKQTGEVISSYTMLTINADHHPLMLRMHRPDPKFPPDQQDKRSVVAIELGDVDTWLQGSIDDATKLMRVPSVDAIQTVPKE
ncbi:MAG: SOS response-associated peptidase family protein [Betaproteobacteria bacterium]|nr:SOS response-associated peptidase family protein [Betaproteobacteria bacterium]